MQTMHGAAYTAAGKQTLPDDVSIAQVEVCKLFHVTPETAAKMVIYEQGYRSQPHEEDAYVCGEVVQAYWDKPDHAFVRNPGTCTRDYADALRTVGASS